MPSPVGAFFVAGTDTALHMTSFSSGLQKREPQDGWIEDAAPLAYAIAPLEQYFSGDPVDFKMLIAPKGTAFQLSVWAALQNIPYGQTASYGDIARKIGKPGASRAVGGANNANPLPVIIPCHRVIGADGSLTGFGGGLDAKVALLELEGITLQTPQLSLFE